MKLFVVQKRHIACAVLVLAGCLLLQQPSVLAQPFGKGVFGADVPFGSATSIGVSVDADPSITTTLSAGIFSGSASHTVTVTSTDVVGYQLYVNGTSSTTMSSGADTLAASSNSSANPLATNSWGYNTTGSISNFIGMTLSQVLIKDTSGPFKNGDDTPVTYGAKLDTTKTAGTYTVGVTYTAVGES